MSHRPKPDVQRSLHQALQVFDIAQAAAQLRAEPAWTHGRNAITLRKTPSVRVVLLAMHAGNRLDDHQTAWPITLQVLSGRVRCVAAEQAIELGPHMVLALDAGIAHRVEALEEALCLLTFGGTASDRTPGVVDPRTTPAISKSARLNDIIDRYPITLPLLRMFGLDTCCGGARLLRDAVALRGLELDRVLDALNVQIREAGAQGGRHERL
jgi:quercetin dioxygenase-like cupin family protein